MDVALCVQGIDYLAYAISAGWGISPSEIQSKFGSFNNGRYVYRVRKGILRLCTVVFLERY